MNHDHSQALGSIECIVASLYCQGKDQKQGRQMWTESSKTYIVVQDIQSHTGIGNTHEW